MPSLRSRSRAPRWPPSPAIDLACRLWTLERRAQLGELRRHGFPVLEWRPPEPLELALAGPGAGGPVWPPRDDPPSGRRLAVALFVVPVLTTPAPAVAVIGLVGLLLAAVAIATLWRWPATAAACVFLADYAAALWLADAPVSVVGAAGFGLALLLLLESVDLARRMRDATVDAGVARSLVARWFGFGAAMLVATFSAMPLAIPLAALVPFAAAPFVAAAGVLGAVLALAATVLRPRR